MLIGLEMVQRIEVGPEPPSKKILRWQNNMIIKESLRSLVSTINQIA